MKICIVTFAWSKNYGAAFQAFALQTVLKSMGHDVFILPIDPEKKPGLIRRFVAKGFKATIRKNRERILFGKFDEFRSRYCDYGGLPWGGYSYFVSNCPNADVFVVGSDQVWNLSVMQSPIEEDFYFLKMCPNAAKLVAYAASWSMKGISHADAHRLKPFLARFRAISVREKSGVDILKGIGFDSKWLPDPALLLDSSMWKRTLSLWTTASNALFVYQLTWDTAFNLVKSAHDISGVLGTEIWASYPTGNRFLSPEEWLAKLASSRYVLTNSFHGTVFAILFHVPFAVALIKGEFSGMNERVVALLDRLGLGERIVDDPSDVVAILKQPVDWDLADSRLAAWRHEAYGFLDVSCSDK